MNLSTLVSENAAVGWLFAPTAILLGALHGLEPGHSKTMMAAFIIAVRGTLAQAALLAATATLSHTAIVWILAILALSFGGAWGAADTEPYLQLASGLVIIGIALWMMIRLAVRRQHIAVHSRHHHDHPARAHAHDDHAPDADRSHAHDHHHPHDHDEGLGPAEPTMDAHERAHAEEIRDQFAGRHATTAQVALFGLTSGLLPCSAAVTVLLLCLQLKKLWLGVTLVLCFSIGLALTLLVSGAVAAWGMHHASRRWKGFDALARRAPLVSSAIVLCLGAYLAWQGLAQLWTAYAG